MAGTRAIQIRRSGFKPKKRLGQHFIKNKGIIHQIIEQAGFKKTDQVLEIGAGLGALTIPLAGCVNHIVAVEKDAHLANTLNEKLISENINNVTIINRDILMLNPKKITSIPMQRICIIGNLPYNISSPFLEWLVDFRELINKAVLMFQSEFATRLIASPGGKAFGAITVFIQYNAEITPLLKVSKEAFYPKPKVDSLVLAFDMRKPHPRRAQDEAHFRKVVKGAFAQRRKTIQNSLRGALPYYTPDEISSALRQCHIDIRRRAETLNIDEFLCLSSALSSK